MLPQPVWQQLQAPAAGIAHTMDGVNDTRWMGLTKPRQADLTPSQTTFEATGGC